MVAAIYSRKSRSTEKGESVENQIKFCKEYGERLGIKEFIIYQDEGFSGSNINRPQFKKLIKDAKGKKFTHLICYRLDRISRNVLDFSQTIEELKMHDIEFISIREQFDTSTPMGRAMMNIAAVFAQLERETIAERIRDNMLELAKTGRWLGGTTPLGFKSEQVDYCDNNGKSKKMFKLVPIEQELETVKLVYELFLEKKTFSATAAYLCKNCFKGKNGGEFSKQTVKQIITNPVYCVADESSFRYFKELGATVDGKPSFNGFMVYNKRSEGKKDNPISDWIFSVGEHPGIINSSDWIKCQSLNSINAKQPARLGTGNKFLLASMVTCGCCGSGMASWSRNNPKTGKLERYYRCNLKNRAANRCENKMLNAYWGEDLLIKNIKDIDIKTLIKNYDETQNEIREADALYKQGEAIKEQIDKNSKTVQGLIRKMALLDDDPNIISMFKEELEILNNETKDLKSQLETIEFSISSNMGALKEKQISIDELVSRLNNFKQFIDCVEGVEKKRELILSVVESIVWYGDSEKLEVNLIGSGKPVPRGAVLARNLCYGNNSR